VDVEGAKPADEGEGTSAGSALAAEPEDRRSGPARVLVRTIGVLPAAKASPTGHLVPLPDVRPADGSTSLIAEGVPAGVRLVLVGLVPIGATDVDPDTLRAAWIAVTREAGGPATPTE
jgi:hypothetical protein